MTAHGVRPNPCPTCPYRVGAPSGIWAAEEYERLRKFDGDIADQARAEAFALFCCHSTPDSLCAGWVGHRDDPADLLAVRVGVIDGRVDDAVLDYSCDVPLFASGAEAAEHGLRDLHNPGAAACAAIDKLVRLRWGPPQ